MKTYKKHHYEASGWTHGWPDKGLLRASYQDGDSFNTCSRCGCSVKLSKTGTMKFWVGGKWISKRPPCQVTAQLPDVDRMLPSFAWEALVEFLVQRLEEAPMGPGLNPVYDYVRACADTESNKSRWVRSHLFDALTEAKNRYEDRHPPGWDNSKQQGYREGIKSRW